MSRLEQLQALLKDDPEDAFLRYALAMEYRENDPEKSLEILQKLTQTHPEYAGTYYHLAALQTDFDQIELAKATYEKGIEICRAAGETKLLQEIEAAYEEFLFEFD
ncbi:MAG: tetratricopeptide repeat protein [Bacteroidota bacterium]